MPNTSNADETGRPRDTERETRDDLYEAGLAVRKAVLGAEHVERSLAQASEFARPIQELVTEYCWGAVWTRDGLDRRTRSLLNLAMLTALNRGHELGVHVRGAITNGVTRDEIRENATPDGNLRRRASRPRVVPHCGACAGRDPERLARFASIDCHVRERGRRPPRRPTKS